MWLFSPYLAEETDSGEVADCRSLPGSEDELWFDCVFHFLNLCLFLCHHSSAKFYWEMATHSLQLLPSRNWVLLSTHWILSMVTWLALANGILANMLQAKPWGILAYGGLPFLTTGSTAIAMWRSPGQPTGKWGITWTKRLEQPRLSQPSPLRLLTFEWDHLRSSSPSQANSKKKPQNHKQKNYCCFFWLGLICYTPEAGWYR